MHIYAYVCIDNVRWEGDLEKSKKICIYVICTNISSSIIMYKNTGKLEEEKIDALITWLCN